MLRSSFTGNSGFAEGSFSTRTPGPQTELPTHSPFVARNKRARPGGWSPQISPANSIEGLPPTSASKTPIALEMQKFNHVIQKTFPTTLRKHPAISIVQNHAPE